ncbi:MAG TPA: cysteine--tRNA ligase [Chthoniobacterales bacterium]|nr:cysteine--tRNA ligase [Chthoniobacterales bacterium]
MPLRLFNTYSRALEEFHPLDPAGREVKMYTCGPTVYSHAHIGNLRAYLFEDLLQRHLELRGFEVRRVMNITDVDDKTIRGAQEAGIPLAEFTSPFKQAFFEDLDILRIKRADSFPEATDPDHIAAMIEIIKTLMTRDLAYQAEDKSVYFRINKFAAYGQLAHFDLAELRSTGRVKNDEYEKENVGDFALWKAWDEEDGPVRWESPWGAGRPGWHIECSAMATQLLGEQLDIHCGGVDNIFPHHEAEIAQTEGCTGRQFVRYWVHCAHLMVDGQKMSKSLGNFYTLRDVLAKGYSGRETRYALMRVHYRAPLNFTWEGLEESREALRRIDDWVARLREKAGEENPPPQGHGGQAVQPPTEEGSGFEDALDDDLNISAALGVLFETIRETNRALDLGNLDSEAAGSWLRWWDRIDRVLAISREESALPPEIAALAEARMQARLAKDWRKSDELRDELAAKGWVVRDTKDGQKVTRRGGV